MCNFDTDIPMSVPKLRISKVRILWRNNAFLIYFCSIYSRYSHCCGYRLFFCMMLYYMMENGHKLYDEMIKKYTEYTEADFQRDAAGARVGDFSLPPTRKSADHKIIS